MKLIISLIAAVAMLSISSDAHAQTPAPATVPETYTVQMDGMEVPMDVLMYAQMKYQGYAVVQAAKEQRGATPVVKLVADRDDDRKNFDEKHLFFDAAWKLLEEKDIQQPAPVKPADDNKDKQDVPKPEKPNEKPRQSREIKKPEAVEQPAEQTSAPAPTAPPDAEAIAPEEDDESNTTVTGDQSTSGA